MYDQSYTAVTLSEALRKGDFHKIPSHLRDSFRETLLEKATASAHTIFDGVNPISAFHLKKKSAYKIRELKDDLVVRKLSLNLKKIIGFRAPRGRSFVISNLHHFLAEGVPYRVYRLDVKSFYESFSIEDIKKNVLALGNLTPLSKRHLTALLDHFDAVGGQGLPRGMGISAILSDWLMSKFDAQMHAHPAIYFYGRYVDDMTIVTNLTEDQTKFLSELAGVMPMGLKLNKKKTSVFCVEKTKPIRPPGTMPTHKFSLSYLGYQFSVFDPLESGKENPQKFRLVRLEIAPEKVKKIKLRIIRSFLAFKKNNDYSLLVERIRFLTSNFSVMDKNTGERKLSGIYYSYPLLSDNSETLVELDEFLRNAILSKLGRLFSFTGLMLSSKQKRRLLSLRFTYGHKTRQFINLSPAKIGQIEGCWLND